jgi:hypothetical protein
MSKDLLGKGYAMTAPTWWAKSPEPVGYWILCPGGVMHTGFAMYSKPTDEQIKNTEQLLGWKWKDAK